MQACGFRPHFIALPQFTVRWSDLDFCLFWDKKDFKKGFLKGIQSSSVW